MLMMATSGLTCQPMRDTYIEKKKPLSTVWLIICLFVLFGLYVAFNNLLVISRQYLNVAGSLMLGFRVLPH